MFEGGNWLLPHVGGVLYPDKPPLFFWLVAALYAVFRVDTCIIPDTGFACRYGCLVARYGPCATTVDAARRDLVGRDSAGIDSVSAANESGSD